jgi:hypothetical protein
MQTEGEFMDRVDYVGSLMPYTHQRRCHATRLGLSLSTHVKYIRVRQCGEVISYAINEDTDGCHEKQLAPLDMTNYPKAEEDRQGMKPLMTQGKSGETNVDGILVVMARSYCICRMLGMPSVARTSSCAKYTQSQTASTNTVNKTLTESAYG